MPSSPTTSCTRPSPLASDTVIVPPGRVYRIALSIEVADQEREVAHRTRDHRGRRIGRQDRQSGLADGLLEAVELLADHAIQPDGSAEFASGLEPRQVEQIGDDPGESHRFPLELRGEP